MCNTVLQVLIIVGVALMFGVLCARLYKVLILLFNSLIKPNLLPKQVWFSFVYRGNLMMIHEILDVDRSRLSQVDTLIVLGVVFTIEAILLIVMYTVEKYKPTCQCLAFNTSNPDSTRFSTCTLNLQFVIITFVVNSIPVVVVGVLAFKTVIEFRKDGRVLGKYCMVLNVALLISLQVSLRRKWKGFTLSLNQLSVCSCSL